mgnify:FL=1
MKAQKKFRLKRNARLLQWFAWDCLIFFAIFLTTLIVVRSHSDADWNKTIIIVPVLIGLLLPLLTGLFLTMLSTFNRQELLNYKKSILTHRAHRTISNVIVFLQEGKIQEAIDEYLKCRRYPEAILDDYTYGMLLGACLQSSVEKHRKIGLDRTNAIMSKFDSNKVVL